MLMWDAVYWQLTKNEYPYKSPVQLVPEIAPYVIHIDAISKGFAATGMRVGWAVLPPYLQTKMKALIGHMGAWAGRPEQIASAALLIPYALYASRVTEPKRRAWLLTLITASTCGPIALGVVLAHVWPTFDAAAQFTDAPAATFACRFFVTFLVLDCAVGALHYRKQFHIFEGWIHHAAYTYSSPGA